MMENKEMLTLEKFSSEIKRLVPNAKSESIEQIYNSLAKYYLIHENAVIVASGFMRDGAMKLIKPEARGFMEVLYVALHYECGEHDMIPMDIPYELVFVDTRDGEMVSVSQIQEEIRKEKSK